MKLLDDFYEYATSQEVSKEEIYEERGEGFTVVAFSDAGEDDCIYNIAIVFYDNEDDVEIYTRRQIKDYDEYDVLKKMNELNCEYTDVTFLIDDDMLTVKSHILTNGELEKILIKMVSDVQLAKQEFVKLN